MLFLLVLLLCGVTIEYYYWCVVLLLSSIVVWWCCYRLVFLFWIVGIYYFELSQQYLLPSFQTNLAMFVFVVFWAIILSILIIILFNEKINDYLEKNGSISWKLAEILQFLSAKKFFEKFWEFHFFKFETTITQPFLKILSFSFLLASPFLEDRRILHKKNGS